MERGGLAQEFHCGLGVRGSRRSRRRAGCSSTRSNASRAAIPFHGGGKHWSASDAEYHTLAAWVRGETRPASRTVARIIQTNAAGDDSHVIDPATNKVVGVINDIRIPHGITSAPDGSRIYISNEALHTLDAVDALSLSVVARVPLSGRPNNVSISKDGARCTSVSRRRRARSTSSTPSP